MHRIRSLLRNLFRRGYRERDLDAEVRAHLDLLTDERIRAGLPPAEARRAARIALGGLEQVKEEVRAARAGVWIGQCWQDIWFGARQLRRNPGFTAAAALTLALGIGANTAIFSMVNAVLIRPMPFEDSSGLVRLFHVPPQKSFPGIKLFPVSPANFLDWKDQSHSFEGMSAYSLTRINLTGVARPESLLVGRVAPDFFAIVRTPPYLGRVFLTGEEQPGSTHVIVLSNVYWKSHLGSDPRVVGQDLVLEHERYTIVGVMPPSFGFQAWGATSVQVWIPLIWTNADRAIRGNHNYGVIARLKPGVGLQQATAEMDTISARLAAQYPNENTDWGATVVPLQELIVGNIRNSLWILLGAVSFVLLIACANLANLLLGRALGRRKEMAVRAALGAGRSRLVRQALSETLLLSLLGGAVGFGLARVAITLGASLLAGQIPRGNEVDLDSHVLLFTLAVSLASALVAGISPGLRMSKTDLNEVLKQGLGRAGSSWQPEPQRPPAFLPLRRMGTRGLLIVCEVALSLMLLTGAGLMFRTLWALHSVDPGFDANDLLTLSIAIPRQKYPSPVQQSAFYDELLRRVRGLPGVESAAFIDSLPLTSGSMQPITIEGHEAVSSQDELEVRVYECSPGYIHTMRIPLKSGRDFREEDDHAVLISDSMARKYWPKQNPIGRRMSFTFTPGPTWQIVGVVGDVPDESLSVLEPRATAYQWTRERPWNHLSLVARSRIDPLALSRPVSDALYHLDPEQPAQEITTMREIEERSVSSQRFLLWLLAGFACIALLLAACGIYGVLSYAVRQRAREIGIRAVLGATVGQILGLVLTQAMQPVIIGILIGLTGALSLGWVLQSLLFGVKPTDAATLAVVSVLLAAVACMASLAPSYRASRVDPMRVLREE